MTRQSCLCLFLVWLFLECCAFCQEHSLFKFHVNTSSLSITSFLYNPTSKTSAWVDRILGSKAVFHQRGERILINKELSDEEIKNRIKNIRTRFSLPEYAVWPYCSMEFLGYGLLNVDHPLMPKDKKEAPSFGNGTMKIDVLAVNSLWTCYYRALYENWRSETPLSRPNYWSIFFYCPSPNLQACNTLNALGVGKKYFDKAYNRTRSYPDKQLDEVNVTLQLTMRLRTKTWYASVSGKMQQTHNLVSKSTNASNRNLNHLAICVAIPYTSNDYDKAIANGAMIFEFVRYYAKLGIRIIMYDRDGSNRKYIYDSAYGNAQDRHKKEYLKSLTYFPYTIRGILDPNRSGIQYDNTEALLQLSPSKSKEEQAEYYSRQSRYESQGHDKTLTFTHCRFEAKAVFGIQNAIVIDFDEFLYCPVASPQARSQSDFINRFIGGHIRNGIDQVLMFQRLVSNTTSSTRDCVVDNVKNNISIFDCFAPYEYYMGSHSVKSLHIGHTCPLTGYHQACPHADAPRAYDCICETKMIRGNPWRNPFTANLPDRECSFVHLSTNPSVYTKYSFLPQEVAAMKADHNELWKVANGK